MKKKHMALLALALSGAMVLGACGNKAETETTQAAENTETTETTETTGAAGDSTETTAAVDDAESAEIAALEATVVPDVPKLSDMGTITLPELSQVEAVDIDKFDVTDDTVESEIEYRLSLELEEVSGAAADGDTVNIDYVGTMDGEEFSGGSADAYDLTLGSGTFIDGFETQLIGTKAGDQVTVKVTFPEDYGNSDLAGKPAEFAVTVNAVKREPELTDAWVQKQENTEAKTVSEYRAEIRKNLEKYYEASYHSSVQSNVLQAVVDASEIQLSDAMKEYGTAYVIDAQLTQMSQYGFSLESLLSMYGMTAQEFKDEMSTSGEEYAKQYFLVQKVAADQGIKATDELLDQLAENISDLSGTTYNRIQLITQFGKEEVESEAVTEAVLRYLESQVKLVKEETETTAEAAG